MCELKKSRIRVRASGRAVKTEGREVPGPCNWVSLIMLAIKMAGLSTTRPA
jgi:hypothetical protein